MRRRAHGTSFQKPLTIDGVQAYMVTLESIPPQNRERLLVHVHGGCYVSYPGEAGTREAVYMAGFGGFKVISLDYRMAPDHPYPAALDDAMTVWNAAVKMADPKEDGDFWHLGRRCINALDGSAGQEGNHRSGVNHPT